MKLKLFLPVGLLATMGVVLVSHAEPDQAPAPAAELEQAKALRVLLLTGGCCHEYAAQKVILEQGISQRANVVFTVIHEGGNGTKHQFEMLKEPGWENSFDAVLYNICFAHEEDVEYIENITNTHKAGLPAVALHCTYHSHHWKATTDEWERFIGVTSPNHGPRKPVVVTPVVADHPVMKGFPETWTTPNGELYNVDKVWPTATVLANGEYGSGVVNVQAAGSVDVRNIQADIGSVNLRAFFWRGFFDRVGQAHQQRRGAGLGDNVDVVIAHRDRNKTTLPVRRKP